MHSVIYYTIYVSNLLKTATLLLEKGASILKTHVSEFSFPTSQSRKNIPIQILNFEKIQILRFL